ncbi:MAG: 7TM-DISM domain-containing protein, partial [Pseudomonas sp.]|nr:7TM-DISM domain-containing protein [Pseudomonas sp.]
MRWLRIAIGITVSLLTTLLCLMPAHAASGGSWSMLSDPQGDLQLSDVRSARLNSQFTSIELENMVAAEPGEALWLKFRLQPDQHEQILRVFAPDLSRLDLYVLDDHKLITEVTTGNTLPQSEKPLSSSDYLLPLPQSDQPLDVYLRMESEHQLRPHITLSTAVVLAADQGTTLLYGLLLGGIAMLVLHNLIRFAFTRTISCL